MRCTAPEWIRCSLVLTKCASCPCRGVLGEIVAIDAWPFGRRRNLDSSRRNDVEGTTFSRKRKKKKQLIRIYRNSQCISQLERALSLFAPASHFLLSPRPEKLSAPTFSLNNIRERISRSRDTQKFINKELLCDGRNNGKVRARKACRSGEPQQKQRGKVWGARTSAETANREECREIEETGKPWRMAGERPAWRGAAERAAAREDKRRGVTRGEVIPAGS